MGIRSLNCTEKDVSSDEVRARENSFWSAISLKALFLYTWTLLLYTWWWMFSWDNDWCTYNMKIISVLVAEEIWTDLNIIKRWTGLYGMKWCLADQWAPTAILYYIERGYSSHGCTTSLVWKNSSPKLWTRLGVVNLFVPGFF